MTNIEQICSCQIDSSNFLNGQLRCYAESPQIVTFRAQLFGTTEIITSDLLSNIEEWIGSSQQFVLDGVQLTLNTTCPVRLASFEEDECPGVPATPATDPIASPNGSSGTLIASVVLGVLLLASLACNLLVIAFVIMSRRKRKNDFQERDISMPNAYNEHRRRRYVYVK